MVVVVEASLSVVEAVVGVVVDVVVVRCCEQNECISIEQLYIKPTRVEQSIDEYTGRVAMASHPPFSLC